MKVLVLDNYDSFTWNLVQAFESLGPECIVHRSDRISLGEIESMNPERIVLSPGPFGPDRAGICGEAVSAFSDRIPILGVCLGMQVIAVEAGAEVRPSGRPIHGRASTIHHVQNGLFTGLPNPMNGARYHSLHVDELSPNLEITAWAEDEPVMAFRSKMSMASGVLFHPESFLTECGPALLANFLRDDL